LAVICPTTCCIPLFANVAQGQLRFPATTFSVLSQCLSRSCRCLVPGMSMTKVQKLYAEVNCIGCDTSYNVLRSTFSSIWIKYNSVSLLLHSQFFLNVYHGRVAALCQVCRRQICKNFMQKLTALAVIRPTTCCIPRFRQSTLRTTPFPFYYILSSSSMFIAVLSLPGARYVDDQGAKTSCRSWLYWLWYVLQRVAFHVFVNLPQGQLRSPSTTFSVLPLCLSRSCRCLVPGMCNTTVQ